MLGAILPRPRARAAARARKPLSKVFDRGRELGRGRGGASAAPRAAVSELAYGDMARRSKRGPAIAVTPPSADELLERRTASLASPALRTKLARLLRPENDSCSQPAATLGHTARRLGRGPGIDFARARHDLKRLELAPAAHVSPPRAPQTDPRGSKTD